ncbi:hypothetical protein C8Q79DRAFT_983566 [Trametes meyenii]|nr:hypothetical protein C8Q79DRAFT_983566 [Trametes meyenii]
MPVTFRVAEHPAEKHSLVLNPAAHEGHCTKSILKRACPKQLGECKELLQTSLDASDIPTVEPNGNGFVWAVLAAYKSHHNLIIRPDDVWIAILNQLSSYVNAHAEELRDYFVSHQGKQELVVSAVGSRYTLDFGSMARQMTQKIEDHVVDKTLVGWILPDFTTTTVKDTTVCAISMMSTLRSYFNYRMVAICGIPSVTLAGDRADWEKLLARLDRLPALGEEPRVRAAMLRPILSRFVGAFDGVPDVPFWRDVAHRSPRFYGPGDVSGWITAFCVWSERGEWRGGDPAVVLGESAPEPEALASSDSDGKGSERQLYVLDGIRYPAVGISGIPPGYSAVDVSLDDNGETFECVLVGGHVGYTVVDGDTLSPRPQWFMYVKKTPEEQMPNSNRRG